MITRFIPSSRYIDVNFMFQIKVTMNGRRYLKSKLEIAVGSVPINAPGSVSDWTGASAPNWTGTTSRRWSGCAQANGKVDSPHRWSVAGPSTTHMRHENSAPALIPSAPPPPPYTPWTLHVLHVMIKRRWGKLASRKWCIFGVVHAHWLVYADRRFDTRILSNITLFHRIRCKTFYFHCASQF